MPSILLLAALFGLLAKLVGLEFLRGMLFLLSLPLLHGLRYFLWPRRPERGQPGRERGPRWHEYLLACFALLLQIAGSLWMLGVMLFAGAAAPWGIWITTFFFGYPFFVPAITALLLWFANEVHGDWRIDNEEEPLPQIELHGAELVDDADCGENPPSAWALVRAEPFLLDADRLAEGGFIEAYEGLKAELLEHDVLPAKLEERQHADSGARSVRWGWRSYLLQDPSSELDPPVRASLSFFQLVNDQLADREVCLYALYGGPHLHGVFLRPDEAEWIRRSQYDPLEHPYLMTDEAPWFGQPH